jgi:hypothetical protein
LKRCIFRKPDKGSSFSFDFDADDLWIVLLIIAAIGGALFAAIYVIVSVGRTFRLSKIILSCEIVAEKAMGHGQIIGIMRRRKNFLTF